MLQIGTPIPTPLTSLQVTAAEGPDGAVFLAAQSPGSASPSVVYVVDGNGPTAVAEHFPSGVAALAASADSLYVATYSTVTAFSRVSGNQSAQWTLPPVNAANSSDADLVAMTAAAGHVFVSISQGNMVSVYSINPSSAAAPVLAAQGLSAAVGMNGTIYYEAADHHLTSLSSSGTSIEGPTLADAPNGEGGGVQYVTSVAGGAVWVGDPAGQGEDTQWTTYDASSLQQIDQFSGNLSEMLADTSGGALMIASPGSLNPCTTASPGTVDWCLSRVSNSGQQTDSQTGFSAIDLVGPDPVLIATLPGASQVEVWRVT